MDDLLRDFLTETFENLDVADAEIVRFEKNPHDKEALGKIFRLVHTVKGTCGFLALARLEKLAHAAENLLGMFRDGTLEVSPTAVSLVLKSIDRIKQILVGLEASEHEPEGSDADLIADLETAMSSPAQGPAKETFDAEFEKDAGALHGSLLESAVAHQSVRVSVALLERMMTLAGELVLTRNQLLQIARGEEGNAFKVPLQRLSSITSDLQDSVMRTRMQPIGNAWAKLPRLVRDLSEELGKRITLDMSGAETELDRQVLELIKDPLVHLVRNSADHGLESPADRRTAGKSEAGHIKLSAHHEGGYIVIDIADDGRGLGTAKIRAKAVRLGLATEAELAAMSEPQIHKLIFAPGFSTADKVTNVSGRGVGLDVVRSNIEQIGGTVDLWSVKGKGAGFTIKIPLTLAIVSVLIVEAGGERYAVPQISVVELVRTKPAAEHRIEVIHETPVLRLRDRLLPLIELSRVLGAPRRSAPLQSREAFVIVTQAGNRDFGIVVDKVYDTEEIVVKPVASMLRDIPIYSGNTILGDGSVIMIIDPTGIAASIEHVATETRRDEEGDPEAAAADGEKTALLVFRAGGKEQKAVPLSLVTRLEELDAARIEACDGRYLVQYRGRLMPVQHIDSGTPLKTQGRQPILVFSHRDRSAGLAVDEIVDITQETLDIELKSQAPGIIGSAMVKGHATAILDAGHFLSQIYPDWLEHHDVHTEGREIKRLLLVDDSPFFLNLLSPLLSAAGYRVTTAASVEEALRLKDRGLRFDVIVSDVDMPGTDGLAFATAVKGDEAWRNTRLVAFTALSDDDTRRRAQAAGFDALIGKSERERLVEALKSEPVRDGEAA